MEFNNIIKEVNKLNSTRFKYFLTIENRQIMEILINYGNIYYLVHDRSYFLLNKIKVSTGFTLLTDKRFNAFPDFIQKDILICLVCMEKNKELVLDEKFKKLSLYNEILFDLYV